MRRHYDEIVSHGAELIALGTGDVRYARAFISEENIEFPVLLDEDGDAADSASVKKAGAGALVGPRAMRAAFGAYAKGHRQKLKTGRRPTQLGATFVIGPGDAVRYEHLDEHVGDHAPVEEILAAISTGPEEPRSRR